MGVGRLSWQRLNPCRGGRERGGCGRSRAPPNCGEPILTGGEATVGPVVYEQLDDSDRDVVLLLGYAVARAQLFELALLKLLEAQRLDADMDPDERWTQILHWLTKYTARRAANKLRVPEPVAADLSALVAGRDFVVHHSYRFYLSARGTRGDSAVGDYLDWFHSQAAALGHGYNGLMSIVAGLGEGAGSAPDDEALMRVWREHVPESVPAFVPPDPRLTGG